MSARGKKLDKLFEEGFEAAKSGKSCDYPGTRSLERAAWENGYRAAKRELMIRVFWTNHGYYSQEEFTNLDDAVAYVRTKCFEAAFHQDDRVLAGWSPIGGLRMFN
jgi:hypothetical protein